jgi:hypothetical protein
MKIQVTGEAASAKVLSDYLAELGYQVTDGEADYGIHTVAGETAGITLTGGAGELADHARRFVEELAAGAVAWREAGPAHKLHVAVGDGHMDAAERGVLRALLQVTGHGVKKSWFEKYISKFILGRKK